MLGTLRFVVTEITSADGACSTRATSSSTLAIAITEGVNAGGFACHLRHPDGITLDTGRAMPI